MLGQNGHLIYLIHSKKVGKLLYQRCLQTNKEEPQKTASPEKQELEPFLHEPEPCQTRLVFLHSKMLEDLLCNFAT